MILCKIVALTQIFMIIGKCNDNVLTYCHFRKIISRTVFDELFVGKLREKGLQKEFSEKMQELIYTYMCKTDVISEHQRSYNYGV